MSKMFLTPKYKVKIETIKVRDLLFSLPRPQNTVVDFYLLVVLRLWLGSMLFGFVWFCGDKPQRFFASYGLLTMFLC